LFAEPLHERGLAGTGLPGHQRQAAPAGAGIPQSRFELGRLAFSLQQHGSELPALDAHCVSISVQPLLAGRARYPPTGKLKPAERLWSHWPVE
jgi:hypothetical protein